jgi:hypothetical protein
MAEPIGFEVSVGDFSGGSSDFSVSSMGTFVTAISWWQ